MDDALSREEEQLKQRVRDANAACSPEYKEELKSGGCFGDKEKLVAIRALVKAEDELAKFRFKRDVESEMKRMDSVIEEEVKRVEELNKKRKGPQNKCAVCDVNLSNKLALVSKNELKMADNGMPVPCCGLCLFEMTDTVLRVPCCGLCLCPACAEDQGNHCQCPAFPNGAEYITALKKLASQNIGWAMYKLYNHLANGGFVEKDPTQARRWLLKAAKSGVSHAQVALGLFHSKILEMKGDCGSFNKDEYVCIKWLSKAADQGDLMAYWYLAKMAYFCRESISPKDAFKYCSITGKFGPFKKEYIYLKLAELYGEQYRTGKNHFELGLPSTLNLSIYWAGKFQENIISTYISPFSNHLVFDARDVWYPHSAEVELPGRSVLPLVRRLEKIDKKYKKVDKKFTPMIFNGDNRYTKSALRKHEYSCIVCNKQDRKNLKVCSGCKVFHYCDVDCQKKHWYAGHKNECQKKHWIESFFPDL